MATLITDPTVLATYCRERQSSEQRLAKRLYEAFALGAPMKKLQTVGCRVVQEMVDCNDEPLKKVLGECQVLDIFKSKRFVSLDAILKKPGSLTPSDIADIIYICGEWVLAGGGKDTWPSKAIQGAYKVGVTPDKPVKGAPGWAAEYAVTAEQAVWKQAEGGRHRGNWQGGLEQHIADHKGPATSPGIAGKRSLDGSTVLKVDRLFGLLRGADISGSTAEAASILERWGYDLLHPAYYLLPLATLVYNCHHTVLEVALTLSLNGLADYHIGFYTTLLPEGAPDELKDIVAALKDAEAQARHFVVFFENGQPSGCFEFTQAWEKNQLRKAGFGRAIDMLAHAQRLPNFPSRQQVVELIRNLAPGLAASLPGANATSSVKLTVH